MKNIPTLKSSFNQPGYAQYSKVESSLLKSMKGKDFTEEFEFVCALYKDNVSSTPLKIHRNIGKFSHLSCPSQFPMFSEVVTLLKIVLINPSTNSASEWSFSAMRRIKTYLMFSMSQARLSSTVTLHVLKRGQINFV